MIPAAKHGFGKKDSHAQIVEDIGQAVLKDYAEIYRLTDHLVELISTSLTVHQKKVHIRAAPILSADTKVCQVGDTKVCRQWRLGVEGDGRNKPPPSTSFRHFGVFSSFQARLLFLFHISGMKKAG